jgi:hypothetical protein
MCCQTPSHVAGSTLCTPCPLTLATQHLVIGVAPEGALDAAGLCFGVVPSYAGKVALCWILLLALHLIAYSGWRPDVLQWRPLVVITALRIGDLHRG